jgi:hypothetical protein
LKEEYTKWKLILHHPWQDYIESLTVDSTFVPALEAFSWKREYHTRSDVDILRKQLKWHRNSNTGGRLGRHHRGTTHTAFWDATVPNSSQTEEATAAASMDTEGNTEDAGAWIDADFSKLFDGGPMHGWSLRQHDKLPGGR